MFRCGFGADFAYEDAFDFDSISYGSFEYDNVSCEFLSSIGDADLKRSDGRIEYFNSRTLKIHTGTDILRALVLLEKKRTSSKTAIVMGNFNTGFECPS